MSRPGPRPLPRADRFAARTEAGPPPPHQPGLGPCLLWTGSVYTRRGGYGAFHDDHEGGQRQRRAHRVAWELSTGKVLTPEQHVLHRCDVRLCVRFEHLYLGNQAINMADMAAKGRRGSNPPRGADQYRAALADDLVLEARRRFAAGEEVRDIVGGCANPGALRAAIYGQSWRHVEMPSYAHRERPVGQPPARCPSGHAYTQENTGASVDRSTGYRSRYCRMCNRIRGRVNSAKKRAAVAR